ncbi:type VII secretion protein EssB [Streptococcus macacae]|uniref:Type VII secretion protein EssB n=1 Tax=Streptococcus macacae NCTC 11558 TaxID=764298 RepID=G5JX83_9STRE|nr:type VII secretion protein EssB [Streptococcus macacae]EHJ53296.1 type VII secretion protein EssB [Streptococcus macacae NCTC 11558]SUN77856.1 Ukp protein [Streptococcus macacae NCTC 11558]
MIEQFNFLGQNFIFEKNKDNWQLVLKRSDINLSHLEQLQLLEVDSPHFLPQSWHFEDEHITFTYQIPPLGESFSHVKQLRMSEQLRFCLNLLELKDTLRYSFGFILHPINFVISKDLRVQIAYRSLMNAMIPQALTPLDFLRQCQSLIVSLFTGEDFLTLYEGGLEVLKLPRFLETVRQSEDLEKLEDYLMALYEEKRKEESETQQLVSKYRFKFYKYATIWLTALAVILCFPLVYLVFFQSPFQAKMLQADKSFLKFDYNGLIDDLDKVPLKKLPYTQKYELAYAYIKGLDFNDEQRGVVLNNVTLKSDELYLDYWIQIGRGNNGAAVDTAKRLDDVDLILYALAESITATRKDSSLSAKKRDEKLSQLQSEYDQYWDDRKTALAGGKDGEQSKASAKSSSSSSKGK